MYKLKTESIVFEIPADVSQHASDEFVAQRQREHDAFEKKEIK